MFAIFFGATLTCLSLLFPGHWAGTVMMCAGWFWIGAGVLDQIRAFQTEAADIAARRKVAAEDAARWTRIREQAARDLASRN